MARPLRRRLTSGDLHPPDGTQAVLGVVALVGAVVLYRWYQRTPPALRSAGPGTVRLAAPGCPGAPAPRYPVTLLEGSTVRLEFVDIEHRSPPVAVMFREFGRTFSGVSAPAAA